MESINITNIIKHIDVKEIERAKESGKSIDEILRGIDLRPIIKEEMVKNNPSVTDEEVGVIAEKIDLVKILGSALENKHVMEEISGKSFEELTEEEMQILQGAGDIDVEATPTVVTTSSYPCIGALSALAGGALSLAKC